VRASAGDEPIARPACAMRYGAVWDRVRLGAARYGSAVTVFPSGPKRSSFFMKRFGQ
jgi:hypothetical protein